MEIVVRLADFFDFRPTTDSPVPAFVAAASGFVAPQTDPRLQPLDGFDGTQVGSGRIRQHAGGR
jgi:hypothetical protein